MMKKAYILGTALLLCSGGVMAQQVGQPDLASPAFQKQVEVKKLYREAWDMDNESPLTTIEQLEYIQQNNPGFDEDTLAIMRRGTEFLKKMDFGLKDANMEQDAGAIRENPTEVLTQISKKAKTETTAVEALEAVDLIEPSKRLLDALYQDKTIEPDTYQFTVDDF